MGLLKRTQEAVSFLITGVRPNTWFSPSQPLSPMAPAEVKGRQFDYSVSRNLFFTPRASEPVSFRRLKALYLGCDLLRSVINRQMDLLEANSWIVRAKDINGKAAPAGAAKTNIALARKLLEQPEPGFDFGQWVRRVMPQVYVYDALTIWPRRTVGGQMFSFDLIDGATITPMIDQSGRRPLPPSVAYQQILKGVPAVDYSLDELLYFPKNPRVDSLYGESRVEMIVNYIDTAIERLKSQKSYFTAGNMTDGLFGAPEDWTTDQIKAWQGYWDELFSGNVEARRHGWWVPAGIEFKEIKQPPLKDEFDEWLARVICYNFSTNPAPFIKQQNRSNQESQQEVAEEGGIATDMAFIKRVVDRLFTMAGWLDIEFNWENDREFDPQAASEIADTDIGNATLTINEARDRRGQEPVEGGDTPILRSGTSWTTLDAVLNPPDPPQMDPADPLDENGNKNAPPSGGAKKPPAKKAKTAPAPKDKKAPLRKGADIGVSSDRPALDKAATTATVAVAKALQTAGVSIAHQVQRKLLVLGKADDPAKDDPQATAKQVADDLDLSALDPLADAIEPALSVTAGDAAEEIIAKVGPDSKDQLTGQASVRTVAFARDRSAELIGKRRSGNGWIDNPNAAYAIDESTRDMVRKSIGDALEAGDGHEGVMKAISTGYGFSPERAALITHTEIRRANSQGALVGARTLAGHGVKMKKVWLVGQEPCLICIENAATSMLAPLDIDENFASGDSAPPAHPNCYCTVTFRITDDFDYGDSQ